ncbi:adaptor-related protein complex 5, beta 1 subunit [Musa troglodytarum]|uniref:Adaptor-related protein complex 5, beta 1 subunit n=1 Tax=Musa troglodytarum TaxID=320322 RepID=A0A9E7KEU5_9LILI|nr:adaptor-related protein complex 5, beta 1 subunit [Musa troglodytarum]
MEKQQSMAKQPPSPSLSLQEWETLLDDFGSGSPARCARWLPLPLLDLALNAFLRRDFASHLKPLLLLFIDDLLSSPTSAPPPSGSLPPLFDALRSLVLSSSPSASDPSPAPATALLRDQFMATAVSAAVSSLDAPLDASSAALLEPLVEALLTVANRPNHGPDRQSRAAACECLRELESAFPCLLADAAGHLWALAQAERTHVAQSYLLLLATVVRDIVLRPGLLSSPTSILSTSVPLVPFNVPSCFLSHPSADRDREPSEVNLREIKRVLGFLWERPQALTPAATMELVSILTSIAGALEQHVPTGGALLKVQFSGLIYSYHPILCHIVLMLYSGFPDAFAGEDERNIARRLALMAREAHQPLVFRLLALHWLLGSPRLGKGKDSLAPLAPRFYPGVFDPLALKAKKLDALACIAASLDTLEMRRKGEEDGRRALIVKLFQDGLVCISAYKWLPPWSTETSVAFRTLHKFLVGVIPHRDDCSDEPQLVFLMDSTIFSTFQNMLVNLALEHHGLVLVIGIFIDQLLKCKGHQSVGERLLQKLDEHLLPKLEMGYRLTPYFPIFERIAENDTIPPHDLEVRDNARIYLRMLVCIPGKKLRQVLNLGEQPSGVSPSPHPGSLFQVPSPRHLENIKKPGSVSSYIHLERVVPLIVKQSWSLVIPKSNMEDNTEASNVVGISDISISPSAESDKDGEMNFEQISYIKEPLRVMDANVAEILGVLRKHFSCIPDYRHMPAIKIRIPCTLRFESEPFSHVWGDGSSTFDSEEGETFPAMYATTITFSSTAKYGKIPPCRVPFLLSEPLRNRYDIVPASNSFEEGSNHRASVNIELEPREPMPGLIDVTIKANAENGEVISGRLLSIAIGIEDMFLKASIPPDIEEDEVSGYYYDLFHALWEACGNSASTGRETFPLSGGKGAAAIHGTRSVKLLEVFRDSLIKNVEKHLASYVVSVVGDPLVNIVRNNGIIRDVVWENDAEAFVNALVPYSENVPLQLPYFDEQGDAENLSPVKLYSSARLNGHLF